MAQQGESDGELKVRLLRDPIPGEELEPDAFGVVPVAVRLVQLFASVDPPFTVSLSGAWGIGKTTLTETVKAKSTLLVGSLDLWAQDIKNLRRHIVVEIGTLLEGGDPHAARNKVAKDIDKPLRTATAVSQPSPKLRLVDVWHRLMADPAAGVWAVAITLLWILGFLLITAFFDGVGAQVLGQLLTAAAVFLLIQSGIFVTIGTTTETLAPAQAEVAILKKFRDYATVTEQDRRAVLMILDNLDRLPGEEAVRALAEIRSLVEVKGSRCLFLIPVDRSALARHLEQQLGDDEEDAARDFLDKFFNLDVVLTRPVSLDLRNWARDEAAIALPTADPGQHSELAQIVASAAGGSPRLVKRMLNGVAARATLLGAAADLSLGQLALVESLISRHPRLVEHLAANPQAFVDARLALRQAAEAEKRTKTIDDYLSAMHLKMPVDALGALRNFLLQNEEVPLDAGQLQTILSLREDRVWRGVPNAAELKQALATGEQDALETAFRELGEDEQDLALRAAAETITSLRENNFERDGLVALSAVAGVAAGTAYEPALRRVGQELVLHASPAVLGDAAIDLVFAGSADLKSEAAKDRLVQAAVATQPVQGARALLRGIRNVAPIVSSADQEALRKALATYEDADLEVLFETPGKHSGLLRGGVLDTYQQRLSAWAPGDEDQTQHVTAAERLAWLDNTEPLSDAVFDQTASRFASQVSATGADRLPTLAAVVAFLKLAQAPSSGIDSLVQQLAQWSADPEAGLTLAWQLPAQAPSFAAVRSVTEQWISNSDIDALARFLQINRAALVSEGLEVATLLGGRFASKGEMQAAELAVADNPGTTAPQFAIGIGAIAATDIYMKRLKELTEGFANPRHTELLEALAAGLVTRASQIESEKLPVAAGMMIALARLGVAVDAAIRATEARVAAAGVADLPGLSEGVQRILEAKLPTSDELPEKILDRSVALGSLHLPSAVVLGRRASLATSRTALVVAVGQSGNTPDALAPVISGLAGSLKRDWRVTNAAVARAGSLPRDEATKLLDQVKDWNVPPGSAAERSSFEAQLTQIADAGLAPDSVVSSLRR